MILATFKQTFEKYLYLPKTLNGSCLNQLINIGAGNSSLIVLFKQIKLFKGSFLNNTVLVPEGCQILIGNNKFNYRYESPAYIASPDCLFPKENFIYNEVNNSYNSKLQISNISEFCDPTCTRVSLSGLEISRCEKCYNETSCPDLGICKDNVVQKSYEECDDGTNDTFSVCSHYCDEPKPGYKCNTINQTSICSSICGDGILIKNLEDCDDGNLINGDGCDITCKIEEGYVCKDNQWNYSSCYKCAEHCKQCLKDSCVLCQNGFSFFNGSCLYVCPEGTRKNNQNICEYCNIENCSQCNVTAVGEVCLKCMSQLYLTDNKTCNDTCPSLNYFVEQIGVCSSCPQTCTQCSKNLSTSQVKCTNCISGYFTFSDKCVNSCEGGFYFNGITCATCNQNCKLCFDSNYCKICTNNYLIGAQGKCVAACGLSEYNSSGVCKACNTECLQCNNINSNCTECTSGYIKDQIDTTHCVKYSCPNYCSTCDFENCSSCISDNYRLLNNKCQPSCPNSGYYLNQSQQTCLKCPENCLICSSNEKCDQCKNSYYLINNFCSKACDVGQLLINNTCTNCNLMIGLQSDCNEKCGDGILYSHNSLSCDDGNIINGDGCSSICKLEENSRCKRKDEYTADICYDSRALECALFINSENSQILFLQFNKNFNLDSKYNISDMFYAEIPGINSTSFTYAISKYSDMSILFTFEYKVSFQNATLSILIKNLNSFYDSNNISFSNTSNNLTLSLPLPRFIYLDLETQQKIKNMAETTQTVAIATVSFSAAPLALIQAMNVFWCLVDAMQIANFYLLINLDYPLNAEMFFKILSASNMKFLPNYFESIFNLNFTIQEVNGVSKKVDPLIQAPSRFEKLGMTSSFIKNSGGISGLMLIVFIVYVSLSATVKILEQRKSKNKIAEYVTKLYKMIRYNFIMRLQLTIFLDLTLATLLQLRVCSAKEKTYLYGFILSVVCLCYLFYFFYIVLRIVNDEKVIHGDKEYDEIYGTLYEGLNVARIIPRNYQPIMIIRKFIFCCILVYSHDYPFVTISLIGIIQILSALLLVKYKPFVTVTENIVAVFSEIFLSIVILMILAINILQNKERENANTQINNDMVMNELNLGWALISFCLTVLALYLLLFGYAQYINYKKAKEIFVEVQRTAKNTLQKFKSKIMERTWSTNRKISKERPDSVSSNPNADSSSQDNSRKRTKFSKFRQEDL